MQRKSRCQIYSQAPFGDLDGPSELIAADEADFGTTRIQRWFDCQLGPRSGITGRNYSFTENALLT
jgi:hypothetical protein